MKRIISAIIIFFTILTLCACEKQTSEIEGKVNIVAVNFPAYDFARQVGGAFANVSMLLPTGSENHSYEPTAANIIKIQECDLFIYTGGESDAWVEKILESFENKPENMRMIDTVPVLKEDDTGNDGEIDEHVWTSPANAIKIVQGICAMICVIDQKNSDVYEENALEYIEELRELDRAFDTYFLKDENRIMIFGDRFPFRYFAEEYDITYYSAFPGCAAETEASVKTVAELIDKAKETGAKKIFYIEFSNHMTADTIASAVGAETVLFHSCHNVTKEEFDRGETYLSIMTENLERLRG